MVKFKKAFSAKRMAAFTLELWRTRRAGVVIVLLVAAAGLVSAPRIKAAFSQAGPSGHRYDRNISAGSAAIFQDKTALYSYTKKFGPKKTVLQLHQLSLQLGNCHENAHEAGRFAYDIFGDQAFKEGSAECHSGLYHGATEAYFKKHGTANLDTNLKTLCSYGSNGFFNHQCFHGIGHGLMAWTGYEIHEGLESCDLLDTLRESCYTGVFMENIVGGLASETPADQRDKLAGHFTKYLSDDPQYPCNAVAEKYRSACYFMQTSRMTQLFPGDFAKVSAACAAAPSQYHQPCFESMGRDAGATYSGRPELAIAACSTAPADSLREGCLSGAVQDSFWDPSGQDQALHFCRLVEGESKDGCYATIFDRARDVLGSDPARQQFCAKAEDQYRSDCLQRSRAT